MTTLHVSMWSILSFLILPLGLHGALLVKLFSLEYEVPLIHLDTQQLTYHLHIADVNKYVGLAQKNNYRG